MTALLAMLGFGIGGGLTLLASALRPDDQPAGTRIGALAASLMAGAWVRLARAIPLAGVILVLTRWPSECSRIALLSTFITIASKSSARLRVPSRSIKRCHWKSSRVTPPWRRSVTPATKHSDGDGDGEPRTHPQPAKT